MAVGWLALELEGLFKEKAKENQKLSQGKGIQKSEDLKEAEVVTIKEVGKLANVSHDTIAKVKKIQEKASGVSRGTNEKISSVQKGFTEDTAEKLGNLFLLCFN